MRTCMPRLSAMRAKEPAKCTQYPDRSSRNRATASAPVPSNPSSTGVSSEYSNCDRNQFCRATRRS